MIRLLVTMLSSAMMLAGFTIGTIAQDDDNSTCPIALNEVLQAVEQACAEIDGNRICYGNELVNADLRALAGTVVFEDPGDQIDVMLLDSLQLSALDAQQGTWGVAQLRVRAATTAAQLTDMQIMVFGDIQARNEVTPRERLIGQVPADAQRFANLRILPNTESFVADSLPPGTPVEIVGRSESGAWYRVEVPTLDTYGWVSSDLLTVTGDPAVLTVDDPQDEYLGPMQAFLLTGEGASAGAACEGVPLDGLLIQTPAGPAQVKVYINEISVDLLPSETGNTIFVQTGQTDESGGDDVTFNVLQGTAFVTSDGVGSVAIAGSSVSVPVNPDGSPSGIPTAPVPYDGNAVSQVPMTNTVNVIAAPPAQQNTIDEQSTPPWLGTGNPNAGGGNPNAGGGNPNAGGGNPNAGGGNPNAGGGNPNAGGGNPNAGGGNPNAGGGNPNAGGGNPNAGGGNPGRGNN